MDKSGKVPKLRKVPKPQNPKTPHRKLSKLDFRNIKD